MKTVLLIGRYSTAMQRMSEFLGRYFLIQLCSDSAEMLRRSLDRASQDIAIVSLTGMGESADEVFSELKEHPSLPCICIGTTVEHEISGQHFRSRQFYPLTRPLEDSELLAEIGKILEVAPDGRGGWNTTYRNARKNILLVDDNPMQLRALRAMLQHDYDVTMTLSGAEALAAIGKRVPDLIFLDYEMPVCDGEMTLKMIRGLEEAKNVPVVFLTAVQDREHILAVLALKPAGYILKPASQSKIEETVKKFL